MQNEKLSIADVNVGLANSRAGEGGGPMTLPEALTHTLGVETDVLGRKHLIVADLDAAAHLSAYIAIEDGDGSIRGPFTLKLNDSETGKEVEVEVIHVQLLAEPLVVPLAGLELKPIET